MKDTAPSGGATLFPVADCGSLAKTLPLTSDWTALEAMVDAMTPSGMTNVTIGMVWGWHALTQSEPFTQAQAVRTDVEKVHDPADRRPQHGEPLHHQCGADRQTHRGGLRQRQEGEDHASSRCA